MKEVIAGLVVLETARLYSKGGVVQLTEDQLHAAIVEALGLAEQKEIPYAVHGSGNGADEGERTQVP